MRSYDGAAANAPKLVITYTALGGSSGGAILAAAPHKEQGMQLARLDTTSPRVVGDAPSALVRPLQQNGGEMTTTTITYTYDALYRLTNATYTTGDVFTYTYDAVGNRLTQTTLAATTVYTYDIANRLVNVGGVAQTWDNNGNLLNDGASTYAYDSANRLKTLTQGANTYTFGYNGLGDRLQQTLNGNTTTYVLDLNAGLTQVLADGTSAYLYGNGWIAQQSATSTDYFLTDVLGSVRQLTNSMGQVTLARNYQPYGFVLNSVGSDTTNYSFAGEWQDATGLIHLRARYYGPQWGRFITRDPFPGIYNRPASLHPYMYGYNNPMLYTDPSGKLIPPPMPRICWFGVDPTTGVCKDPFGLPPIFANASMGSMGSSVPGAIVIGGICLVGLLTYGAYRLVTQSRPVTWGDLLRLPEPQPTKVVVLPTLQPQPTATDEPRHITLGLDVVSGQKALVTFTYQVRRYLGTDEVYYYEQWYEGGLTTISDIRGAGFNLAFAEATSAAVAIHFNLDGISDPIDYAQTYGSSGVFPPMGEQTWTAIELYLISNDPWRCGKTTFYRGGAFWGRLREVPEEKVTICQ